LFVFLLVLFAGCNRWAYKIPTDSMAPTIKIGDSVWVDHSYYDSNRIQRFDIVMFEAADPRDGKQTKFISRIVGLGGEQIELKAGKLLVNGRVMPEVFDVRPAIEDSGPFAVPANEYFLMGDNRDNSYDSRFREPATISRTKILGKVTEIKHN
jgi:signal peptidase I